MTIATPDWENSPARERTVDSAIRWVEALRREERGENLGVHGAVREPDVCATPFLHQAMALSGRHDDPKLEQLARDTFALFPLCHVCGRRIERFEDADIRVLVQRVVHRGGCPAPGSVERLVPPVED